jgi:hypothetical protein
MKLLEEERAGKLGYEPSEIKKETLNNVPEDSLDHLDNRRSVRTSVVKRVSKCLCPLEIHMLKS